MFDRLLTGPVVREEGVRRRGRRPKSEIAKAAAAAQAAAAQAAQASLASAASSAGTNHCWSNKSSDSNTFRYKYFQECVTMLIPYYFAKENTQSIVMLGNGSYFPAGVNVFVL